MKLFKQTRFRLRTMLLAIAVVAFAAYLIREWALLRDAREQFNHEWASWNASRATVENVVLTSGRLMKAEAAAPWISERAAEQLHVARLNRLLESIESDTNDSTSEAVEAHADYVRREIDKFGATSDADDDS